MNFLKIYQAEINYAIEDFFKNYRLENPGEPERQLKAAMEYGSVSAGKRIRPILGLLGFEVCRNPKTPIGRDEALKCLISLELIHAFSLIHDDLPAMDNDELRRGCLTVWKKFGEAQGLLAGDTLNTLAFELLADHAPDYALRELIKQLSVCSGINGMSGGQARDLYFETRELTLEELIETHRKKTGRLIYASALMGAALAHAEPKKKNLLGQYAEKIGLAFQVKDDLLDVEGDEKIVGKKIRKDMDKKGFIKFLGIEETRIFLDKLVQEADKIAEKLDSEKLRYLAHFIRERQK